mmetsp:Transcript_69231/g.157032  ORF Transcript_69231/g.157032 Transcript_69231/m.157032 type:complete len:258 (-) Transcript_69231:38-811(-)
MLGHLEATLWPAVPSLGATCNAGRSLRQGTRGRRAALPAASEHGRRHRGATQRPRRSEDAQRPARQHARLHGCRVLVEAGGPVTVRIWQDGWAIARVGVVEPPHELHELLRRLGVLLGLVRCALLEGLLLADPELRLHGGGLVEHLHEVDLGLGTPRRAQLLEARLVLGLPALAGRLQCRRAPGLLAERLECLLADVGREPGTAEGAHLKLAVALRGHPVQEVAAVSHHAVGLRCHEHGRRGDEHLQDGRHGHGLCG